MDLVITALVSLSFLLYGAFKGFYIGYPLLISLGLFIITLRRRGFKYNDLFRMVYRGGKKSFIVLQVFVLIGAIISVWISSGTVPAIVYYGIRLISPKTFLLSAFVISSMVSFLIGTSFGTVGTAGVALMVMARSGGINPYICAGAIISGAYFGDRCSPVSSSANLVSNITETDLYINIRNMLRTAVLPFIVSCLIYGIISYFNPLVFTGSAMDLEIQKIYNIGFVSLIPAIIILLFSILRVNIKVSILVSIAAASVISIVVQGESVMNIVKYIFSGYVMHSDSPLKQILNGGGILSMLKVALIVFVSSAFSGIFEGTNVLSGLEKIINKYDSGMKRFMTTIIVSTASAAFGCSQAIAIILTGQLIGKNYGNDKYTMAVDIENTAVVISPLLPWNIAGLVPAQILSVSSMFIPFAFYLYLLPVINLITTGAKKKEMEA